MVQNHLTRFIGTSSGLFGLKRPPIRQISSSDKLEGNAGQISGMKSIENNFDGSGRLDDENDDDEEEEEDDVQMMLMMVMVLMLIE